MGMNTMGSFGGPGMFPHGRRYAQRTAKHHHVEYEPLRPRSRFGRWVWFRWNDASNAIAASNQSADEVLDYVVRDGLEPVRSSGQVRTLIPVTKSC